MNDAHKAAVRAEATPAPKSREYRRPFPANWWLRRRTYFLFMLRELTAIFVGAYAMFLLVLIALGQAAFVAVLSSPWSMVLHLVALPAVLYHSVTWINLTPKVMVVWQGEDQVRPALIAGIHFGAWILLSLVVVGMVRLLAGG